MSLESRLAAGETLCTAWSGIPDALTVELLASAGLRCGHARHAAWRPQRRQRAAQHRPCCVPESTAIVRIPVGRFDMASRALDFGAEAVIAPMINSVEDARRFAAAMKYPPIGERSWGPTYAFPRHGKGDFAEWLREQQPAHRFLRHDRDPRGARCAGRHPRNAWHRCDIPRAVGLFDRLEQRRDHQLHLEDMMETVEDVAARATQSRKACRRSM